MNLFSIYQRYMLRISLTMCLVLAEALAFLLLPLVIGMAIDGLLAGSYLGVWKLGFLGLGVVVSGALRRFYDTRVYAGIYVDLSTEIVEQANDNNTSKLNARVTMLKELVEFLENQLPELMTSLVGLVGAVAILYALDFQIFLGCLLVIALMLMTFIATGKITTKFNHHYNNAMEAQVVAIEERHHKSIRSFMTQMMRWNIKLSDLETLIFSVIWLGMTMLIVFSVVEAVGDGAIQAGAVMAMVMYVFQFAEGAGMLPLYFQQFLRLQEISTRLKQVS